MQIKRQVKSDAKVVTNRILTNRLIRSRITELDRTLLTEIYKVVAMTLCELHDHCDDPEIDAMGLTLGGFDETKIPASKLPGMENQELQDALEKHETELERTLRGN